MIKCTKCNAENQASSKFCSNCGARVSEEVSTSAHASIELFSDYPRHNLEVQITSVSAKGPDSDQTFGVEIAFVVVNKGSEPLSFLSVTSQVLSSLGCVVGDTSDFYENEIAPGDSGEFETSIWGVNKDLLGINPESAKVIVSAIAATGEKNQIFKDKILQGPCEVAPVVPNISLDTVEFLAGSYWQTNSDEENETYLESRILLQNMTSDFYPQAKLFMDVHDKKGELLDSSSSYQELVAEGVVGISASGRFQVKDLSGGSISLGIQLLKFCGVGFGISDKATLIPVEEEGSEDGPESSEATKRIYIKTEPGGRVMFGRLSDDEENLLKIALASKVLPEELSDLRYNGSGELREYEGVFNQGDAGDFGNEGTIVFDDDGPVEIPIDSKGNYIDGSYFVFMSLSKVSIEFEFTPNDGEFDVDNFEEVSVPVILPECVTHELYGHPDFNVVIDYRYDGQSLEEYNRELVDRGYDDQIVFVVVKSGVPKIVYKNYNGDESWPDLKG